MMAKRLLAISMAAVIAASALAGCQSGSKTAQTADSSKIDTSKHVTVNMTVLGDPPSSGSDQTVLAELNKKLTAKINATIKQNWIEWADYETKYNLLLASGQQLDLVFSSNTWLDLDKNVQKGSFLPLDDLLPQYAPDTWKNTAKEEWAQCTFNGKIYCLPENKFTQYSTPLMVYRKDWAKQFGIPDGDITSIAQVEQYWQGIKDNMKGVIPYAAQGGSTSNELYSMYFRQMTQCVDGAGDTGYFTAILEKSIEDPYTAINVIDQPWFLDFAKLCKKWGDADYWTKDVMNNTSDTQTSMLAGKSGTWTCNAPNYYPFVTKMKQENPDAEVGAFFFDGPPRNMIVKDVVTQDCCSVGANSENPERALMAYDLLAYDKEINQLSQYGIEGKQYTLDKDGRRVNVKGNDYAWDMWSTRNDSFNIPSVDDWTGIPETNAMLKKWVVENPWDTFHFDPSSVSSQMNALTNVCAKYGPAIQYGKAGDPTQAVQTFRTALKQAGIDSYLAELNKQLAAYKASRKE